MTKGQTAQVITMKQQGHGYKKIAAVTGLPLNTVKSYCSRHKEIKASADPGAGACMFCNQPIVSLPKCKPKKFCSDRCRMGYWNSHRDLVQHRRTISVKCPVCGIVYESHGDRNRHYCSRACYLARGRKGDGTNE